MASSRRWVAAGAWVLAVGLVVGAGGANAFADTGSGTAKDPDSAPAAAGHESVGAPAEKPAPASKQAIGSKDHDESDGTTTTVTKSKTTTGVRKAAAADTESAAGESPAGESPSDESPPDESPSDESSADDSAPSTDATPPEESSSPTTFDLLPTDEPITPANDVTPYEQSPAEQTPSNQDPPASDPGPSAEPTAVIASTHPEPDVGDPSPPASEPSAEQPAPEPVAPVVDATEVPAVPTPTVDPVATPVVLPPDVVAPAESAEVELLANEVGVRSNDRGPTLSPLQILRALAHNSGSSFAGAPAAIPTLLDGQSQTRDDGTASATGLAFPAVAGPSESVAASVAPMILPQQLQAFLQSGYGKLVVAVSLSAMFAAALPGLAGLVIPALAGIGIGYRQARAGRALRASGIAHLAPTGPMGVVRSGGLIAMRPPRSKATPLRIGDDRRDVA